MFIKKKEKGIVVTGDLRPRQSMVKPKKCNSSGMVDGRGYPPEIMSLNKRRKADTDPYDGVVHVRLNRNIETVNRLAKAWKVTRTEAILRLLRPYYIPVRDGLARGEKEFTITVTMRFDPKENDWGVEPWLAY